MCEDVTREGRGYLWDGGGGDAGRMGRGGWESGGFGFDWGELSRWELLGQFGAGGGGEKVTVALEGRAHGIALEQVRNWGQKRHSHDAMRLGMRRAGDVRSAKVESATHLQKHKRQHCKSCIIKAPRFFGKVSFFIYLYYLELFRNEEPGDAKMTSVGKARALKLSQRATLANECAANPGT